MRFLGSVIAWFAMGPTTTVRTCHVASWPRMAPRMAGSSSTVRSPPPARSSASVAAVGGVGGQLTSGGGAGLKR